jgi:hypothetical protein
MKKYIITLIILYKSTAGFAQKADLDSFVKLSPKLPTVLEIKEDNISEKLKRPIKTFPSNENLRLCCCSGGPPPLYILDGMEVANLEKLKPENIESISVFNDKKSIEPYGKKGENGVIVITSKKK